MSEHQPIRFSPSVENEQADAGLDCRTRLARPNSQARPWTGKKTIFPDQLTTSRIGNHTWLIHTLPKVLTIHRLHTYTTRWGCVSTRLAGNTMYVCMHRHAYSKSMYQPGKVANPVRGQLNMEHEYFPVQVRAREFGLARRVRQSRPASACSFSTLRLNLVLTYGIPPAFRGGVHL